MQRRQGCLRRFNTPLGYKKKVHLIVFARKAAYRIFSSPKNQKLISSHKDFCVKVT